MSVKNCQKPRYAGPCPMGRILAAAQVTSRQDTSRSPLRVLGSYAVALLFDGSGSYRDANGFSCELQAGDMILVFPQLAHRYGPGPGEHWSEQWLTFEGPLFDLWHSSGVLSESRAVHRLSPVSRWLKRFEGIVGPAGKVGSQAGLVEVTRLQQVLADALVAAEGATRSPQDASWLASACALLESQVALHDDLPALARQLGTSYSNFRKRFMRLVGTTPGRYRRRAIIERACLMMQQGHYTNRQIAGELGFADEFHFAHQFRRVMGRWPTQYRQSLPRAFSVIV